MRQAIIDKLDKLHKRSEAFADNWTDEDGICTQNLLCDRKKYHKCQYRPISTSTYIRELRAA